MPASWTTQEQLDFLNVELQNFLSAQREGQAGRFITELTERWFQKWPERFALFPDTKDEPLTAEQNEQLGAAIDKRKKVSNCTRRGQLG